MDREDVLSEQLAHVLEEIRRLEEDLAAGEMTVTGSTGQPVPNKILAELRAHRWLLVRMLDWGGQPGDGTRVPDVVDRIRAEWEAGGGM